MDRSTIARYFHPYVFVMIGLLCLCITMQILGSPVAFWDTNETEDLVKSSLLEGFSLIACETPFLVSLHGYFSYLAPSLEQEILLPSSLFHPPLSHA